MSVCTSALPKDFLHSASYVSLQGSLSMAGALSSTPAAAAPASTATASHQQSSIIHHSPIHEGQVVTIIPKAMSGIMLFVGEG